MPITLKYNATEQIDPVDVIYEIIEHNRSVINNALAAYNFILKANYPFYTENFATTDMPCLMIDSSSTSVDWIGLPTLAAVRTEITVSGFVQGTEPSLMRKAIYALGVTTQAIINRQTVGNLIGNSVASDFYWTDQLMPNVEYYLNFVNNAPLRSFIGKINIYRNYNYGE